MTLSLQKESVGTPDMSGTFPEAPGTVATIACTLLVVGSSLLWSADCNVNGIDDSQEVDAGASADCNANQVPDECEFAPIEFVRTPEGEFSLEYSPRVALAADLNGDGLKDVATGNQVGATRSVITVLLSREGGTFEGEQVVEAGSVLSALQAADLDGDGDLDLATANSGQLLTLENEGDGVFGPSLGLPTGGRIRFLTTADANGDGRIDLVGTDSSADTAVVFENLGELRFSGPRSFRAGDAPIGAVVADWDGDGYVDLAIGNRRSEDVVILRNLRDGNFGEPVSYEWSGREPQAILGRDLDADSDVDLVVETDAGFSVLLNPSAGTAGTPVHYAGHFAAPAAGDLDGDGDVDLAFAGTRSRDVFTAFNGGHGRFGPALSFALDESTSLVTVLDIDGDAKQDLLVFSDSPQAHVLWGGGEGPGFEFASTRYLVDEPHALAVADVDSDGTADIVTRNGSSSLAVHFGRGDGTLSSPVLHTVFAVDQTWSMVDGDFNNDGHIDIITTTPLQIVFNDGDGAFPVAERLEATDVPGAGGVWFLATGDFDDNGGLDFVTSTAVDVLLFLGHGDGSFTTRALSRGPERGSAGVAVDDLDLDGKPDLVVVNGNSSTLSVYLSDAGAGALFLDPVVYPATAPWLVALGDFNGDLYPDVVTANRRPGNLSVFLNRQDGTLSPGVDLEFEGAEPYHVITADLDGDEILDLATANERSSSVSVVQGNGDGTFRPPLHFRVGGGQRFVGAADLDHDGDLDLVSADHHTKSVTVMLNRPRSSGPPRDFLETICTGFDFHGVSRPVRASSAVDRVTKYLVPSREDPDSLPALFHNVNRFDLHQEFLTSVFPERFAGLSPPEYHALVGRRESRKYYAGSLSRLHLDGDTVYGFNIVTDNSPAELLTVEEVRSVYDQLLPRFRLAPLGYFPERLLARELAASWVDPGFPVYYEDGAARIAYQAYARGVGFGWVRRLDSEAFERANTTGQIDFRDLVVLDFAPRDMEGTAGGLITAEPQDPLGRLSIRAARRGTPNAFVQDALAVLAPFADELVRLEVTEAELQVRPATLDEAEEFWARQRPTLAAPPNLDTGFGELSSLEDMEPSATAVARFGGEATNLARLARILTGPFATYQESGFAVPMKYYLDFIASNHMPSALDAQREVTYGEHIVELLADEQFRTSSEFRFAALERFRRHMRDEGVVAPSAVRLVADRVAEVLDTPETVRVRFRPSSNVDGGLEFSGAGLYDSESGCPLDDFDGDDRGPSSCDPSRDEERGITFALKRVWSSFWNFRAYEERRLFGIPNDAAAMGVLVSRDFGREAARGVAFTGDPGDILDRRYVVTVQVGDEPSLAGAPRGVRSERDVIDVVDGQVVDIVRASTSSLLPAGEVLLPDEKLEELGALLWHIDRNFPLELGELGREKVLLEVEFSLLEKGSLAVRQVRPFLFNESPPPTPTFELEIPAGTVACGVFNDAGVDRGPREEYDLKSTIRFRSGVHELPTHSNRFSMELFEEVVFGPQQDVATPVTPGYFRLLRVPGPADATTYRFNYNQEFLLRDGRILEIRLESPLVYTANGEGILEGRIVLEEAFFTARPGTESWRASLDGAPLVGYGSCSYPSLPLSEVRAELAGGVTLVLEERFDAAESLFDTTPASLTHATIDVGGVSRSISDYWSLVYSAFRHNRGVHYWVILDPPLDIDGLTGRVHGIQLISPDVRRFPSASATYLGENLDPLSGVGVTSFSRVEQGESKVFFRRGDANADGSLDISDAFFLLIYLFDEGPAPECRKAADANDDGRLNLADAVHLVRHTLRGQPLPEPIGGCGPEETTDTLSCERFTPCGF